MLLGASAKRNENTDCKYMEISEILTNSTQKVNAIADKRKNNFILQGHATLVYRERRNAYRKSRKFTFKKEKHT